MLSGFSPPVRISATVNLPVSGGMMRPLLQFRLACHKLPIVAGCRAGIIRASRQCSFCSAGAWGVERHLVFECAFLAVLRATKLVTMLLCSLPLSLPCAPCAQSNHLRDFSLGHRLLAYVERLVITTRKHMQTDLVAG